MKNLYKIFICLTLSILSLLITINSKTNKQLVVNAADNLVAITNDAGNTINYRNTSTPIMRLNEYNYPTQNLRACWVSNFISSLPSYSTEEKWKSDFSNVLDVMESYGLNCIIFHVRTHNNALYKSELNPVATFFKNVNFDEFDPLEWAIEETHRRGIEFHAWLNPYRVLDSYVYGDYPEQNPANDQSNLLSNGSATILNPGIESNRDFIVDTCMEVVENYDVDAIHFDDYFYISGVETSKSGDWKRQQVDLFIEDLSNELRAYNKEHNKTVQLGISPSGIYRNGGVTSTPKYDANGNLTLPLASNTSGFAHYDDYLYSDTLKWINEEWIDYIMPQTYWALEQSAASFGELSKWWSWAVKNKKVNLYLGMGIYMPYDNSNWRKNKYEVRDQILNAEMYDEVGGFSFYSYNYLQDTNTYIKTGMDVLKNDYFKVKIPCDVKRYYAPLYDTVSVQNVKISNNTITYDKCDNVRGYVVYKVKNGTEVNQQDINQIYYYGNDLSVELDDTTNYTYYVSSVNLANEISEPTKEVISAPTLPEEDNNTPTLNIYKKNVAYASEINMVYAVKYDNFDANTNEIKMLFWDNIQDEYVKGTETYEVSSSGNVTVSGTPCKAFISSGIAAKEMTDNIYARAYTVINDEIIYSDVIKYSVLDYYHEMKEAGTANTNLSNLLDAMIVYGAAAQINFNYNTNRLANATYYKINVTNGTLQDGFTYGRYQMNEQITLTANTPKFGMKFAYWQNSNKELISTNPIVQIPVDSKETYEAVYVEDISYEIIDELQYDIELNKDIETSDLPSTIKLSNGTNILEEEVEWDISTYDKTKEGTQVIYGSLVNLNYELEEQITLEVNVLPYLLEYNEEQNEYTITKYIGTTIDVTVPNEFNNIPIVSIEQSAFYQSTNLTSVTISEGIKTIGAYTFQNCSNLEALYLPSTLNRIGTYAFSMCNKLTNIYYSGTIENWCNISFESLYANPMYYATNFYMKGSINNWSLITEITIPDTVTIIKDYQFAYFRNITKIILSNNTISIGTESFRGCRSLSSIILPSTLTSINTNAFYVCSDLKTVYNLSSIKLTKGDSSNGYVAYYANNIYTSLQ